jgi:hypothetical protein
MKSFLPIVAVVACVATAATAQIPEELRSYAAFQQQPNRFFEFTEIDGEGNETDGWVFSHWTGQWRASGEETLTDLQIVHVRHDPEINTPPMLLGITIAVGPGGAATRQTRRMTLRDGAQVQDMPPGAWILPIPLEEGRTWSTGTNEAFRWSRIESLHEENPNPAVQLDHCVKKLTVAAERLGDGSLSVEVEEAYAGEGEGFVWMDQWRGMLHDVDASLSVDELADLVLSRLGELDTTVTLQLIPNGTAVIP